MIEQWGAALVGIVHPTSISI